MTPLTPPRDLIIHLPLIPCQINSLWKCLLFLLDAKACLLASGKMKESCRKITIPWFIINFLADRCWWSTWEGAVRLFCPPSPLSLLPNTHGIIPPQQHWDEHICHTANLKRMRTSLIRAEPPWEGAGWWEIGRGLFEAPLKAPYVLLWGIQIQAATGWLRLCLICEFLTAEKKMHYPCFPARWLLSCHKVPGLWFSWLMDILTRETQLAVLIWSF